MNITLLIESAEHQFKQILEEYFISVYTGESLLSHGLAHHRRVWKYAKELIICAEDHNYIIDPSLPENLIIACYLHDIGMSVDPGIKHGHHSKDLCRTFLKRYQLDENKYLVLLSAIENHDNKDYNKPSGEFDLLTILSVADDLDAFGITGIYRYSEIYLMRGISLNEIGSLVLKNAGQRFDNFLKTFGSFDSIVLTQKERYNILKDFFESYNSQIMSYNFGGFIPTGHCGVIELLSNMIKEKKILKDLFLEVKKSSYDKKINWFFKNLNSEL